MKANEVCGKQDFLPFQMGNVRTFGTEMVPKSDAAKFVMLKKYRMYYRNAKICQNCFITGLLLVGNLSSSGKENY